jgi:hypothetical protein
MKGQNSESSSQKEDSVIVKAVYLTAEDALRRVSLAQDRRPGRGGNLKSGGEERFP